MNRRTFVSSTLMAGTAAVAEPFSTSADTTSYFELRVYELKGNAQENYLKSALVPALNRQGIKNVGVFRELGKGEPPLLYVLIPYPSINAFAEVNSRLSQDSEYQKASESYRNLLPDRASYARYKSSFMQAFSGFPQLAVPKNESRIFELRTYEGFSQDAVRRKIAMFNDAEIQVFNKVGLTPVFFGEVKIGDSLPCLTYLLTFPSMEVRDANWKKFGNDADWKRISGLPEYANTVSRIQRVFLEPVAFSQI
ncbi:NIPSNAP family protein [Siphonobacter sp. SORGH_AS_1065]|uniref:NIPSNAP family protein n=1 Tax=Siphonobacter sp. SORGH_AS_1065 TaxID=3041795 RepID=UPI0027859306|nr:NIPSNAP family protein [Siphonobacter sp. SORGH_AS_1065]MDQ1089285.1 hypothetical protein [Siphonobacter sp. SORGH_AS_1065]